MGISYKQLCLACKKTMVLVTSRSRHAVCYECQKPELKGKIKDPSMKKMFNIPEEMYKQNSFLRSVKINYLKFGSLSEKQVEYFKKTVDELKQTPAIS